MKAYYNEIDPYAAQWLENLIQAGEISPGTVDRRDINDVTPGELAGYDRCHFFAGIAGWDYALRLAGWPPEWPVWTGSCPCQPFSAAGRGAGATDERHLWPAWYWLIRQCKPAIIFGEQVASKDGLKWLDVVFADLEAAGYSCGSADLCAAGVGAPHIRQRLWFIALGENAPCLGRGGRGDGGQAGNQRALQVEGLCPTGLVADSESKQRWNKPYNASNGDRWKGRNESGKANANSPWTSLVWLPCRDGKARPTAERYGAFSPLFPLVARLSPDMGSDRPGEDSPFRIIKDPKTGKSRGQAPWRIGMLKGAGNSIVPQVAAEFIRAVMVRAVGFEEVGWTTVN